MLSRNEIQQILEASLAQGADFAEVFLEDTVNTSLSYLDGKLDKVQLGRDYGLGLRLIKGLETAYGYSSDLSLEHLQRLVKDTAAVLQGAQKGQDTGTEPAGSQAKAAGPSGSVHLGTEAKKREFMPILVDFKEKSLHDKVRLMQEAYDTARNYDALIQQASVSYLETDQRVLIANSEGLWVEDRRPRGRFHVGAIAGEGDRKESGGISKGAGQGWEFFQALDVRAMATEAAEQALTMMRADYAPKGVMPVILDNGFGGVLFHESCGHGLEGYFTSKHISVFSDRLGEQIASPVVTAIDDGTICGEWGTAAYDDEGTPTQRNVLIENGILKSYLVDRMSGKRLGLPSTGSCRRQSYRFAPVSRMNNTFIAPGDSTREEMIAATDHGLYAKKLGGGSVDVTTGNFNFAVTEAYLIENGKITKPVRGATLIGQGCEVLKKIDMVGRELALAPGMCGAGSGLVPVNVGQPPIRITEMTVGGR